MYDLCRTFVEQNNKEGHMHLLMHRLSHSLHFEKNETTCQDESSGSTFLCSWTTF
jgi:hypothetical protein